MLEKAIVFSGEKRIDEPLRDFLELQRFSLLLTKLTYQRAVSTQHL